MPCARGTSAETERHGWNATSFQTVEPGYSYFFHGEDACVAYVLALDALVTLAEALLWNARHARSLVDAIVLFIACAAPALAAVVLRGARRRLRD